MLTRLTTNVDATASEWAIHDDVIRLRHWGTDRIHPLPPVIGEWAAGVDPACAIALDDPWVSRRHAELARADGKWILRDLGSKNGLRFDGARRSWCALEPCLEIELGRTTLIAESPRSIELRAFVGRLLGWGSDRAVTVDLTLRSIRKAATGRSALVLRGPRDLASIAHALHRHARGADRPFVVCDPRRRQTQETVRAAANYASAVAAFEAATGGSLCVWSSRLPRDFDALLARLDEPEPQVQLVVCSPRPGGGDFFAVPIKVPPLAGRAGELWRIVEEYARDAAAELRAPPSSFTAEDRDWVLAHEARSLADIEKATLRLIALRTSRSVNRAAARLGMAHVSLARWIGRHKLPLQAR